MITNRNINIFLDTVCNNMKCSIVKDDIRQELCEHIIEEKECYVKNGVDEEEAELIVIKNMGTPKQISKEFNKIYKKKVDWKLLLLCLILMFINGLLIMTVANNIENGKTYIIRNVGFLTAGIIVAVIIFFMDYKKLERYSLRDRSFRNVMYDN